MSGSIQSYNYVPGVSGWKLNAATGEFEINPERSSASAEPQTITVTAGEWSEYDLPTNAIERYAFIGAEVAKIPAEYRDKAEFATKDFAFDCDGSDVRTTLTYDRPETPEEIVLRLEKAKVAGTRIVKAGGCTTIIVGGVVRARFGNLAATVPEPEHPEPFKVDGDQVYISEATIQDGIIKSPWPVGWNVRMQRGENGKYYAAGFDVGLPSQIIVSADRFAINGRSASDILRDISSKLEETKLGQDLKEQVDLLGSILADQVKAVIRKELMPGGLLHRSS